MGDLSPRTAKQLWWAKPHIFPGWHCPQDSSQGASHAEPEGWGARHRAGTRSVVGCACEIAHLPWRAVVTQVPPEGDSAPGTLHGSI